MPETSDEDTGIIAPPVTGTLLFNGHRLPMLENVNQEGFGIHLAKLALQGLKVRLNRSSPSAEHVSFLFRSLRSDVLLTSFHRDIH